MYKRYFITVSALVVLVPSLAMGQGKAAQEQDDESVSNGRTWGNYTVQQSIELGGRIVENSGNQQMYDTLVNLQSGPRLLGQELSMRSINHDGSLFDNLYLSSFGLGGDPNDMIRLRIEKNKWYNFVGLYRRDVNFFDYNLFANPMTLNPGITNCSTVAGGAVVPCTNAFNPQANYFYTNSPHYQDTTRNMGDFNLTLFPQSAIRVRLGFSRNNNKGTVDSSLEDVNIDLTEQFQSRSDRWSFGVDVRPLARTTLSFEQFFEHDKVDTAYVNSPQNPYTLGVGGANVFIPLYFPPCSVSVAGTPRPYITAPGVLNPLCNTGVFSYSRSDNVRSNFPTSMLSLRSNYFRKLDVTASGTYSSGYSKVLNYDDLFFGLVSRTNNTAYQVTGPASTDRVSGNADLGLTYHISKSWSVSDKFRWLDWRDPGVFNQLTNNCYSNLAAGANLSTPTGAPCGVPGIPTTGLAGAGAAGLALSSAVAYSMLEAERTYFNTVNLNWAPSRRLRAYVGYRYGRRELTSFYQSATTNTLSLAGGLVGLPGATTIAAIPLFTDKINQHTALAGLVLRPTDKWRINADAELSYADNAFTQIAPRHEQRVRANSVYKVNRWISINGGVHFIESRNDWAESFGGAGVNLFPTVDSPAYGTTNHDRYYTLGASLQFNRRVTLDVGWTYMDQKYNIPACMVLTAPTANTPTVADGAPTVCPATTNQPTLPANFNILSTQFNVPVIQAYQENTNTGYIILTLRPMHRVALNLGYEITSTSGHDNWLRGDTGAPLQVLGDAFGNVPGIPGNLGTSITSGTTSAGTIALTGPFPNQSAGPQNFNWHKVSAGIAVDIAKGVTFKGNYAYYDYNEKEGNLSLFQLVALPRNFHTNTGTVSLKYSF
jgi:opacity protein-like surface antigen